MRKTWVKNCRFPGESLAPARMPFEDTRTISPGRMKPLTSFRMVMISLRFWLFFTEQVMFCGGEVSSRRVNGGALPHQRLGLSSSTPDRHAPS